MESLQMVNDEMAVKRPISFVQLKGLLTHAKTPPKGDPFYRSVIFRRISVAAEEELREKVYLLLKDSIDSLKVKKLIEALLPLLDITEEKPSNAFLQADKDFLF